MIWSIYASLGLACAAMMAIFGKALTRPKSMDEEKAASS
jgi:hypothetical protein